MNPFDSSSQNRPLVLGHRGARAYAPMNTLPGFECAAEQGADGIELDIHLSKDGEIVVIHDFTVDATTNGTGNVADLTLAQLKELDAGSWFGTEFAGAQIPTLDEVFEWVAQRFLVNVEIKSQAARTDGIEQKLAEKIKRHAMQAHVIVSSFNPLALRRFGVCGRELGVPIGFLHAPEMPFYVPWLLTGLTYQARHPHFSQVNRRYMDWANRHDYRVNVWTVNDPQVACVLRDLGVNAIITDQPDTILKALSDT